MLPCMCVIFFRILDFNKLKNIPEHIPEVQTRSTFQTKRIVSSPSTIFTANHGKLTKTTLEISGKRQTKGIKNNCLSSFNACFTVSSINDVYNLFIWMSSFRQVRDKHGLYTNNQLLFDVSSINGLNQYQHFQLGKHKCLNIVKSIQNR